MKFIFLVAAFTLLRLQIGYSQNERRDLVRLEKKDGFSLDIRYATTNNFLKEAFYDCSACYLRPEVAKALLEANHYFCERGYRIVLFDCYRPVSAQKKMWAVYPNPQYVANPYTTGSVHNRGAAVDISLEKLDGTPVDMGTDHDFFGREAHIDYTGLPEIVLKNRKILQTGMKLLGFETIRTEWWHFNFKKNYSFPIIDFEMECKE